MYSFPLYVGFGYLIVTVLGEYPDKPTSYAYSYRVSGKKQKFTAKREYTSNNGYGKMVVSNFKSPPVVTSYSTYIKHPGDGPHEEAHFEQKEEEVFIGDDDEEIEKFWKLYDEEEKRKEKEQIKVLPFHHEEHEENNFERYWLDDDDGDGPEEDREPVEKHIEVEDFDSKEYYSDYWKEFEDIDEEPYFQFPDETDFDFWNYFWNGHGDW